VPSSKDNQDESMFASHPDLIDQDWQRQAERRANRAARFRQRRVEDARRRVEDSRRRIEVGGIGRRNRGYRPARRLRAVQGVLGLGLALGVLALVAFHPGAPGARPLATTPPHTVSSLVATPAPTVDLSHPFATTPASTWAEGANGIQPPVAAAVAGHSAAQVAAAYQQVKQVLVASHLDPAMLVDHNTDGYVNLLAAYTRASARKDLATSPDGHGTLTLLAPGYPLLPVPIRVDGSMSAGVNARGEITVHTNYVFAFAFAPRGNEPITEASDIVAVQHVQQDFDLVTDPRLTSADRGLYPQGSQAYYSSIGCQQSDHGLLAPAYADNVTKPGVPTDNPNALYDPAHSLTVSNTCGNG
jgi:hypothetical protein